MRDVKTKIIFMIHNEETIDYSMPLFTIVDDYSELPPHQIGDHIDYHDIRYTVSLVVHDYDLIHEQNTLIIKYYLFEGTHHVEYTTL